MSMKKVLLGIFCIIAATIFFAYSTQDAHSYSSGPPAGRTGSPGDGSSCASGCHVGGSNPISGSANAAITSTIPATGYIPGQTYTVTGTVSGAGLVRFGFQISPQNAAGTQRGTNVITDATNTQLVGGNKYVEHTTAGTTGTTNSHTWSFNWIAPAAGTGSFNFYGAFNATNNSNSSSGDIIYLEQLPVVEAAQINTQPTNQSACTGANASFSISATGTSITYQWKKNGVPLSNDGHYGGVATNTLSITNVNAGDVDSYTCEVTGSGNTIASNAATLTLLTPASISDDPDALILCAGATATFTVTAAGSNITYQWKRNNVNVANGGGISGATTNQLTITSVAAGNAGTYTCQVSNTCVTPTSAGALLTVNDVTAINTQPTPTQTLCAGANLTLTVAAVGTNLSYQWKRGVTNVGTNSPTLTINGVTTGDAGSYTCEVTGACGTVTSNAAVVTINAVTAINTQPTTTTTLCQGGTLNLSVAAVGTNLSYQWKRGVTNVGTNSPNLTVSNVQPADAGTYTVVVTGSCGTVTSSNAVVTVNATTAITTQPTTQTLCVGANLTLTVAANGANLSYQWKRGVTNVGTDSPILTINGVTTGDAGNYTCEITGACGNATSNIAVITVNTVTAINTQPTATQTLCEGTTLNLSVGAVGTNLSYQWKRGTTNVGTNSPSLSIPNTTVNDAGTYTVTVTGACGTVISGNAVVNITPTTAITTQPVTQSGCTGSNITFTVAAAGGNLSYQWKKGITPVGTNSATLTINNIAPGDAGNYTVEITGTCGSVVTSNIATLTVVSNASISQQPQAQQICVGGPLTLTVIGNGGNNTTYQWRRNNNNVGPNSATYNVPVTSANDLGNYEVIITGSCGTVTSASVAVTAITPTSINNIATSQQLCIGEPVTLGVSADGENLSYQWLFQGNPIDNETGTTFVIDSLTAGDAGLYSVTVTGDCGTVTGNISTIATIAPPLITGFGAPLPVCAGNAIFMGIQATGDNLVYRWQKNGVDIPNANQTGHTEVPENGDVFTVFVSNVCDTVSHSFTAVVNPLPVPVIEQIANTALAVTQPFASYQWLFNGNEVSNSNTQVLNTTFDGNYEVVVTDANGCSDTSAVFFLIIESISENTLPGIAIYPNPSNGDIFFTTPANMGSFNVKIISTTGQLILDKTVENKQLNIAQLPSGLYTVLVTYQGKTARVRLAKE
jgi:hypothetical protein